MEREQIIKALECCASEEYVCAQCPIDEKIKDDCECGKVVARNALSLIKELTVELEAMRGAANSFKIHNKKLTEENETLSQSLANSKSILANSKADTVREMQKMLQVYFGTYVLGYKIPLSEAIKAVNQIAKETLEGG